MTDPTPAGIGSLTSTARGSAARFNAGKPDLTQMPLGVIAELMATERPGAPETTAMRMLGRFQEEHDPKFLLAAVKELGVAQCAREAAHTFSYGARKYSPGNWLKGMNWSVPLACAARHLLCMHEGTERDAESGETHRGHFACNVIMLLTYQVIYYTGNDLPPIGALSTAHSQLEH